MSPAAGLSARALAAKSPEKPERQHSVRPSGLKVAGAATPLAEKMKARAAAHRVDRPPPAPGESEVISDEDMDLETAPVPTPVGFTSVTAAPPETDL